MSKFLSFFVFLSLNLIFPSSSSSPPPPSTVHSLLVSHGLPPGLLPKQILSFSLNSTSSLLAIQLNQTCFARYGQNPVKFEERIYANLTFGSLKGVQGLTQEELFLWLPVKEILVADPKSGVVVLDIGMAQKQLSASIFENPPDCEGGNFIHQVGFEDQRRKINLK